VNDSSSILSGGEDASGNLSPNIVRPTQSPKFMDMVRPGKVNPLKPKNLEKSKTLMRSVVQKPNHSAMGQKLVASSPLTVSNAPQVTQKNSISSLDIERQNRANQSAKSTLVSRFSSSTTESAEKLEEIIKPAEINVSPEVIETPPAPKSPPVIDPMVKASRQAQPSMKLFEQALSQATAHQEPPIEKRSSKLAKRLSLSLAGILIVLVAGGFLVYHNVPRIDLFVASSRAGFTATTPGYSPAGYDLANVSSADGVINASYHSNSDSRAYTIKERDTTWDSNTLLDSYVVGVAGQNYETVQSAGRTIYIYGNKDATWVNGGIWYVITDNNSLSDQQLIQLATSM
jgi:hypothetical protein